MLVLLRDKRKLVLVLLRLKSDLLLLLVLLRCKSNLLLLLLLNDLCNDFVLLRWNDKASQHSKPARQRSTPSAKNC